MLQWLWAKHHAGIDSPLVLDVLETVHSIHEGYRLSEGDIVRAVERLNREGLVYRSSPKPPEFKQSNYPRSLAISILQDWVMTQSVRATEDTVDAIFDKQGIRLVGHTSYFGHQNDFSSPALHEEVGGSYLAERLWDLLNSEDVRTERAENICSVLADCQTRNELGATWRRVLADRTGSRRFAWLGIGDVLGLLAGPGSR